jgi:AcrR family transcriptional regulator
VRAVTEPASRRAPRSDALRNRARLVEAATAAFAESGEATSLDDIAQRAGVGIGTLYRHFPTREALVEATYRSAVESLCDAADELLETLPPDQALAMAAALRAKQIPFALQVFDGEQHGFRQADTITRVAEAELWFYGRVLGFTPADAIEPVPIENEQALTPR